MGRAAHLRAEYATTCSSRRATCRRRTGSGRWRCAGATYEGRLAEIMGPDGLSSTTGWRGCSSSAGRGDDASGRATIPRAGASSTAFADGVNAYIEQIGDNAAGRVHGSPGIKPQPLERRTSRCCARDGDADRRMPAPSSGSPSGRAARRRGGERGAARPRSVQRHRDAGRRWTSRSSARTCWRRWAACAPAASRGRRCSPQYRELDAGAAASENLGVQRELAREQQLGGQRRTASRARRASLSRTIRTGTWPTRRCATSCT